VNGEQALRGVGGTRDCDWWFTDRAVLVDTAGRFTTQDSDASRDSASWSGFLAMLRKARPRQPLNGVLVTVSVSDLLGKGPAERGDYAARVRARLQELHEHLGVRLPIYLLVTKADLLAGFADYHAQLDKDTRATPWGYTLDAARGHDLSQIGPGLDALSQRLNDGLIDRLQAETDPQRRARIYGFPLQVAGLRDPLLGFVDAVFAASPYEDQQMLRGVYLVSGTQEGAPIDRLLGAVARSFKLERAVLAPPAGNARSYFLERLLTEVVFAEAGLGGTQPRWEQRQRLFKLAGWGALAAVSLVCMIAWGVSWFNNRSYVDEVAQRVEATRALVQATPNRATPDLLPLLAALGSTRQLAQAGGQDADSVPWSLGFGLFQGRKLDAAARQAYERMLVDAFLPRLALRVEEQVRQSGDAPELQYEALKAYLMLQDPKHFDAEALSAYLKADWEVNLPRNIGTPEREQLVTHLDALLALGPAVSPLPWDQSLVNDVRVRLASVPLPQRIYNRLRQQGLGTDLPEFTVAREGGPAAGIVFVRNSGQPLTRGVPGTYTYKGYHQGLQKRVDALTKELAQEELWVLGQSTSTAAAAGPGANARISDEVRRLYLTDYAANWEAFLADVRLRPVKNLQDLVQVVRVLSGPDDPLRTLLKAVVRETTLNEAQSPVSGKAITDKAKEAIGDVVTKLGVRADTVTGGPAIELLVDDRFAALRRYVRGQPGAKPPMDDTLGILNELQLYLAAVDQALKSGAPQPASDLPTRVAAESDRSGGEPVKSLLGSIGTQSRDVTGMLQRTNLANEVKAGIGDACNQSIAGRYPFNPRSPSDVTTVDFGAMFGVGGRIDRFVGEKLLSVVDTSARPVWRFRDNKLGNDTGQLIQFQRAQVIRETFFPSGGNVPTLQVVFKPVEMDASISQFTLDVDGKVVSYAHGPLIPTTVTWPGTRGTNQVRLQVQPAGATGSGILTEGPWALMRLFDRVKLEPLGRPEQFRATFDFEGRKAVFEVTAASVRNPFRLRELTEFTCPSGL
jgi:type VI secretion system protein ImpL